MKGKEYSRQRKEQSAETILCESIYMHTYIHAHKYAFKVYTYFICVYMDIQSAFRYKWGKSLDTQKTGNDVIELFCQFSQRGYTTHTMHKKSYFILITTLGH